MVDVIMPPTIGAAMGFITSEPTPVSRKIGTSANSTSSAVQRRRVYGKEPHFRCSRKGGNSWPRFAAAEKFGPSFAQAGCEFRVVPMLLDVQRGARRVTQSAAHASDGYGPGASARITGRLHRER